MNGIADECVDNCCV